MAKTDNSKAIALIEKQDVSDVNVSQLIDILSKQLASIEKINNTPWKTNGEVPGFANKIQNETSVKELGKMLSVVYARKNFYDDVMSLPVDKGGMGLENFESYDINKYTYDQFHHDVYLRMQMVNSEENRVRLTKRIDSLKQFVSKEESKKNAVQEALAELKQYM